MAEVLVVYDSRTGNTEKMARLVANGAEGAGGQVTLKRAGDTDVDELMDYDAIIIGSPTYYGQPSAAVKDLIDRSVKFQGKMSGKVGGAFTSSGNLGGGNETTVLAILEAMLIHGMVVQGTADGDHYGPVSVGKPDNRASEECRALGRRVTELADRLA